MTLRLRSFKIKGFKSLNDLEIGLSGNHVFLIGTNGSGKSSVLQALAFIQYFAQGRPSQFFEDRRWAPSDVRQRLPSRSRTSLYYKLTFSGKDETIVWSFQWNLNSLRLNRERVKVYSEKSGQSRTALDYDFYKLRKEKKNSFLSGLKLNGSILAVVEPSQLSSADHDILQLVLTWALGVRSLELLSPSSMRQSGRASTDMGARGERLAGFLAKMNSQKRDQILARVQQVYKLSSIQTVIKRAGWVELSLSESHSPTTRFSSSHMSDGFMRLLALCSIPELDGDVSLILLDEVEDGIEPHILPDLIRLMLSESNAQFVMTSHSPTLVNFFEAADITFICRNSDGASLSASLDQLESFQTGAEYFGNGELWANFDVNTISSDVIEFHISRTSSDTEEESSIES